MTMTGDDRDVQFLADVRTAATIAGEAADDVDRAGRFPVEAVGSLRRLGCLGAAVPADLGGRDVSFEALCSACFELGRRCGSTGMIFAMHQIQVACIVRHLAGSELLSRYLTEVGTEGRLIASATAEEGTGGNLRQSIAPLEPLGDGSARFEKRAPTVSYGERADDLLVTLRRSPQAERTDQVLVLVPANSASLQQIDEWDTLGMRGTCSPGFVIRAQVTHDQVIPAPFEAIAAETMVPCAHILWAHCWLGIASDAFARARAFSRTRHRPSSEGGTAATRLSQLSAELAAMRALLKDTRVEYQSTKDDPGREVFMTLGYAIRINNVKVMAAETAVSVCQKALNMCGLAGYKNDTEFSVNRHLRDALSAPLMVSNDRIHDTNARLLLLHDGT